MTKHVLLNNVQHGKLKVIERYSREAGDHKAAVLTFPTEFIDIQKEYPILLSKDSQTGTYQAVALLGIQKDENLFLQEADGGQKGNGWAGSYVPAIVARGPFITGFQEQMDGSQQTMVYLDMDSPKVSETEGRPLFLEFGGNSPYLEYITRVLSTIHQGEAIGKAMYKAFEELELIEPLTVNIDLKNGDKHRLSGYHAISEEKLAKLSGTHLEKLNRAGFLQGAFLMLASLANLQKLIAMKNARL
jgi:hypothetical protein